MGRRVVRTLPYPRPSIGSAGIGAKAPWPAARGPDRLQGTARRRPAVQSRRCASVRCCSAHPSPPGPRHRRRARTRSGSRPGGAMHRLAAVGGEEAVGDLELPWVESPCLRPSCTDRRGHRRGRAPVDDRRQVRRSLISGRGTVRSSPDSSSGSVRTCHLGLADFPSSRGGSPIWRSASSRSCVQIVMPALRRRPARCRGRPATRASERLARRDRRSGRDSRPFHTRTTSSSVNGCQRSVGSCCRERRRLATKFMRSSNRRQSPAPAPRPSPSDRSNMSK